jgi:hypothetical protein
MAALPNDVLTTSALPSVILPISFFSPAAHLRDTNDEYAAPSCGPVLSMSTEMSLIFDGLGRALHSFLVDRDTLDLEVDAAYGLISKNVRNTGLQAHGCVLSRKEWLELTEVIGRRRTYILLFGTGTSAFAPRSLQYSNSQRRPSPRIRQARQLTVAAAVSASAVRVRFLEDCPRRPLRRVPRRALPRGAGRAERDQRQH